MRVRNNEKLVIINVFKSDDLQQRKKDFNKKYERYINMRENKIC